jgi:hypothetical protein
MNARPNSPERRVAGTARERAAEYLADALAFEAGGQSAEAQQAFGDAVNAERWAVYYEAKAGEHRARNTGRRP